MTFLPAVVQRPNGRRFVSDRVTCSDLCHKQLIQRKLSGRTGGYRQRGGRGKGAYYAGKWMDSTWEVAFAQRMDTLAIEWERNLGQYRFDYVDRHGIVRHYIPDFFLPAFNLFIEIKGFWTEEFRHKANYVIDKHKIHLIVIDDIEVIQTWKPIKHNMAPM